MKTNRYKFMIILLIPLVILIGMASKPIAAYMFGKEVTLETMPIDPSDLFYGDYVILNVKINEVPVKKLSEELQDKIFSGSDMNVTDIGKSITVYSTLEKKGDVYDVKKVSLSKPKTGIYLKGKTQSYYDSNNQSTIQINYGLNRYYIEDNTGSNLESHSQTGNIQVLVNIVNGYGIINDLLVENELLNN